MSKHKKIKLKREEVRKMMEEKLRAQTIPSGKIYKRNKKHRKDES
jgi:hypothetical protein